jgi:Carboxypeptidase regulatory-like domain
MNAFKISLRLFSTLAFLLLLAIGIRAQYRAGISGTVSDAQGGAVSDAKVTVTATETGISQEATTDDKGIYTINRLAPGIYTVKVEKANFKIGVLDKVQVSAEQMNSANVTLEVGAVSESVTVNAGDLPVIDTETGNVSGTLTSREIKALPSFGADPFQLVRLTPGVFGDGASGAGGGGTNLPGSNQSSSGSISSIYMTENQPQIVAAGTRNNGNSYQIDGVEVNSLAWGGSAVITPNQESVKEVQVQANPYSAENGRNSGAQVLVVSQNGTNEFHGSLFLRMHRPGLDAYQRWGGPFGPGQRDNQRFNQFGGSLGGPIWKNKVFFFFSYDTLRNSTNAPGGSQWFETPEFFQTVTAAAPTSIAAKYGALPKFGPVYSSINTVTCDQVGMGSLPNQCHVITDASGNYLGLDVGSPRSGTTLGTLDPTYGFTSTTNPALNTPYGVGGGLDGIPDVFNVVVSNPDTQVATQYNGRMDFQLSQRDLATFTIYWVPNNNTGFFNGPARGTNVWNSNRLNYSMAALWNHTFAPTLLNELRFNVTRWYYNEVRSNPDTPFGYPADNINGIGGVSMQCCPVFGAPGPGVFYQTTYNLRDTLTKVYGSHSLKFGVDIYKEQDNDVTTWAGIPNYQFNNLWDFANDAPISENANFDPRTGIPTSSVKYVRSNIYAFFLQDDWKIKPNFTLNLGLRWEYFGPIHEKYGNMSDVVLGSGNQTLTNLYVRAGGDLYHSSMNNWGPQIGFAWSPAGVMGHSFNNRLVIRGGGGIAYNRLQEAVTLNGRFNPPLQLGQFYPYASGNIVYGTAENPHDIFGYPSNPAAIQTFIPGTGLPVGGTVQLTAYDQYMPTPIVYRYSILGQYDIGHHWVATAGYQGSQSRHFTRQVNNLNWLYYPNLNPSVTGVDWYTNDANASYNALLLGVEHQFAKSFSLDAQYAYSHCNDHGSQDYFSYQYPFSQAAAAGPCDYDATQSFKIAGIWQLPIFQGGNDWKHKVLGGWQASGVFTYHTGFPFSPFYNVNVVWPAGSPNSGCSLVYANSNYCNAIPGSYLGGAGSNYSNSTFQQAYGNFSQLATDPTAYFGLPSLPVTGIPPLPGVQRNSFRGPRYHDFDFAFQKAFGLPSMKFLGENSQVTIRADFWNMFNTLNLSPISGPQHLGNLTLDSSTDQITSVNTDPSFGRASGALGARVVEFQFRFQF